MFIMEKRFTLKKPIPFYKDEIGKNSKFGAYRGIKGGGTRKHAGIDIYRDKGTPVMAARGGRVIRASGEKEHLKYGALVIIDHTPEQEPVAGFELRLYLYTLYAHLDSVDTIVGRKVKQGELIGTVGKTGNAKSMNHHLHFEVIMAPWRPKWYVTDATGVEPGLHRVDPLKIEYVN